MLAFSFISRCVNFFQFLSEVFRWFSCILANENCVARITIPKKRPYFLLSLVAQPTLLLITSEQKFHKFVTVV